MKRTTVWPGCVSVVLTETEKKQLLTANALLVRLRDSIGDDEHLFDADLALAAGILSDLVDAGEVRL